MPANPLQRLRDDLLGIRNTFAQATFLSFSTDEQQSLVISTEKLLDRLEHLAQSQLTVGLLGGTGVGKSTLMNGLAEAEIASTSHRRPHTDRVLIYRHAEGLLPREVLQSPVSWQEITHHAVAARQIVLCDMPDFDSIDPQHHEQVVSFLEHLDLLVWVTSPEKYGDAQFYELLRAVPKARQNFYFVLNKVDLLFPPGESGKGYESLASLLTRFQEHVRREGITHPRVYAVAAREAVPGQPLSPWNQFAALRGEIFQQRDLKEIVAIKAANVDEELHQLLTPMHREYLLTEKLRRIISGVLEDMENLRSPWVDSGRRLLARWTNEDVRDRLEDGVSDPSVLVGPGHWIALLMQQWRRLAKRPAVNAVSGNPPVSEGAWSWNLPEDIAAPLQRQIQRVDDRIMSQLLREALPPVVLEHVRGTLDLTGAWENLARNLTHVAEAMLQQYSIRRRTIRSFAFLGLQYLVYNGCTLLLFVVLAGQAALEQLVRDPGFSSLAQVLLSAVHALFSPRGLAAMGSYMLLQVFLGFRCYGRYKKILQRRSQKFIESLKKELETLWQAEFDRLRAAFRQVEDQARQQLETIAKLRQIASRE